MILHYIQLLLSSAVDYPMTRDCVTRNIPLVTVYHIMYGVLDSEILKTFIFEWIVLL